MSRATELLRRTARTFDNVTNAVFVCDLEGTVVDANRAAEQLAQAPRELFIGTRLADHPDPRMPARFAARLDGVRRHGQWAGEDQHPLANGRVVHTEITCVGVYDDRGELVGVAILNRDVTEARELAGKLTETEAQWSMALDLSPTGIAVVGLDGRFRMVSRALCELVGYGAAELLTKSWRDITAPDDVAPDEHRIERMLAGELDRYTREKRYRHADGHDVHVKLTLGLARDPETGEPAYFVATTENLTVPRLAALRLRSILSSASEPFVGFDAGQRITEWNAAAEWMFGWTRDEAIGSRLADVMVPPANRERFAARFAGLADGDPEGLLGRPFEVVNHDRSGREIPMELTIWKTAGDGDEFYTFMRDISERRRSAERRRAISAAQLAIGDVELSPETVMQEICAHAERLTSAAGACVQLSEGSDMVHRAATGSALPLVGLRLPLERSLSGLAALENRVILRHDDPAASTAVEDVAYRGIEARSLLVAPLRRGSEVLGVLTVVSGRPSGFSEDDQLALELLGAPFGAAMANAWQLEATSRQAMTDAVTGLANRTHALHELDRALLRRGPRGGNVAVVFVDLDRFKRVNDTLGHAAGDDVLVAVAARLRDLAGPGDVPARYGGDEFLIVCEQRDDASLARFGERLVTAVAGGYRVAGGRAEIGASVGIAVCAGPITSADLLRAADAAMYEAKYAGGTRHVLRRVEPAAVS
jgi:diguanylate cyclase (GGDEF)-like protein/PAS domain S-box-containing protein